MRVYFDTCAIQRPLDDPDQIRVRLEAEAVLTLLSLCETGRLDMIASAAHEIENAQNPFPERQDHASDFLTAARVRSETTDDAAERAALYARGGLSTLDALHLALAVTCGAAYFCTTDDRLLRLGQQLNTEATAVVSPLTLVLDLDRS